MEAKVFVCFYKKGAFLSFGIVIRVCVVVIVLLLVYFIVFPCAFYSSFSTFSPLFITLIITDMFVCFLVRMRAC